MGKYLHVAPAAALLMALFIFPTCNKVREHIEQHPSGIAKFCRIDTLTFTGSAETEHVKFYYNSAGDPLEIRQLDNLSSGLYGIDLHFRYDKKDRLSDVLQTDPGLTFVYSWSRYSYPSSRVIIDSVYEYQGNVNDPNPPGLPGSLVSVQKILLDEQGRLDVRYDRNGDRVIPGVIYDDKVNLYQLSRTFQVFFGDFSRNNPMQPGNIHTGVAASPVSYNAYGLPTKFLGVFQPLFGFYFDVMNVTYSCDLP